MSALKLVTPPAIEPVSLEEAKAHIRQDSPADDAYITGLITEARETIENLARRALISQTWRLSLDRWPAVDYISLPRPPLASVTSLIYLDQAGDDTTWASSNYIVDSDSEPGRLVLAYNVSWPSTPTLYPVNPIQITYVAGYGDEAADVPAMWKKAILMLLGHWYENRETAMAGSPVKDIPVGVQDLIWLDRGGFF